MKFLKLIITIFVFCACSHLKETTTVIEYEKNFMTEEEIKSYILQAESGKLTMDGPFTDEDNERLNSLNPLEQFIPKHDREALKEFYELKRYEIKSSVGADVPESIDLRKWDTPIKYQWNGTCTTFAGVAAIENILHAPGSLDLSERDSWETYKQYSCKSFVSALSKKRICNEKDWPQANDRPHKSCEKNRHAGMIETTFLGYSKELAIEALAKGKPVYVGMATPADMVKCYKVIRSLAKEPSGGHALLITGYKKDKELPGGGYFILKNSWGSQCGDHGYQYLPFAYCDDVDKTWCQMWEVKKASSLLMNVDPDNSDLKPKLQCSGFWIWKKCQWVY